MKRVCLIATLIASVFGLVGCASQQIVERHFYEPTPETAFKREDGMTVGAVKSEAIKSGSPDWSDQKSISLISIGK